MQKAYKKEINKFIFMILTIYWDFLNINAWFFIQFDF